MPGFGYDPAREVHHFCVQIERERVRVWQSFDAVCTSASCGRSEMSLGLDRGRWEKIAPVLADEFNARLRAEKQPKGKWKSADCLPVTRQFGKELLVLAWAIEEANDDEISASITNWRRLEPLERWWLFSMCAPFGQSAVRQNWRTALKYALCYKPE